jgi:hypothetical protein
VAVVKVCRDLAPAESVEANEGQVISEPHYNSLVIERVEKGAGDQAVIGKQSLRRQVRVENVAGGLSREVLICHGRAEPRRKLIPSLVVRARRFTVSCIGNPLRRGMDRGPNSLSNCRGN